MTTPVQYGRIRYDNEPRVADVLAGRVPDHLKELASRYIEYNWSVWRERRAMGYWTTEGVCTPDWAEPLFIDTQEDETKEDETK